MTRSAAAVLACSAMAAVLSGSMNAQSSRVAQQAGDRLPVTRVVLYKSGVGYSSTWPREWQPDDHHRVHQRAAR